MCCSWRLGRAVTAICVPRVPGIRFILVVLLTGLRGRSVVSDFLTFRLTFAEITRFTATSARDTTRAVTRGAMRMRTFTGQSMRDSRCGAGRTPDAGSPGTPPTPAARTAGVSSLLFLFILFKHRSLRQDPILTSVAAFSLLPPGPTRPVLDGSTNQPPETRNLLSIACNS